MDEQLTTIRVRSLTRLPSGPNAHPRWRVVSDDGRAWSFALDANAAYSVVPGEDEGKMVTLGLDSRGRITRYEREDG